MPESRLSAAARAVEDVPVLRQVAAAGSQVSSRWHRRQARLTEERRLASLAERDSALLAELTPRDDLKINVGSSDSVLEGWVNVDLRASDASIQMDASSEWPFRDASVVAVNSEHFLEHLTVEEAESYFRQVHRVLRPGGVVRTSTPDLEGLCRTYLAAQNDTLAAHRRHGYSARTHADMLNNYFYLWDHRHIWDFESLRLLLEDTGFSDVTRAKFNRSDHAALDGIDRHDPEPLGQLVLTVDALRP